ncbi:putative FAD-binding domain, FAD/NAD(P)-binding domain superfamily [Septoria linicola]|nr:putative FAD-binding domain, FAD/NAD(P)-binding domain superfamily [Septoria linicola]
MDNSHASVLIAGGSIAGLMLANLLELASVDYLVLEKYRTIAPDLGASIGISANSARLLDQIGVWNKLEQLYDREDVYDSFTSAHADGQKFIYIENGAPLLRSHFGYQLVFIDRQQLIQILYDNLKNKNRVLVNQEINRVESHDKGVRVTTSNGQIFTGKVIVGADGIHSAVRKEMWRLGSQADPVTWSMADLDTVPVEWRCIYGISKPNSDLTPRNVTYRQGDGHSYLTMAGPQDKVYWFLFEKLEQPTRGLYEKVPRYTNDDLEQVVAKYATDVVAGNVTLGSLYETSISATLQALPEMTLPRWHFERMVLIGDAAHKFNPIAGQGSAQAIEDAAVLANRLAPLLRSTRSQSCTQTELNSAFETFQAKRLQRATTMEKMSNYTQQIDGMNGYWHKFMAQYIVPFLIKDESSMIKLWSERILGAARFDFAEMPHRPHSILYDDEKPLKPDAGAYSVGTVCALGATIFSICVASRMFFEICGGGEGDSVAGEFKGAGWCEKGGTRVDLRLGRPWTKE